MLKTYTLKRMLWAPPITAAFFGMMGAWFAYRAIEAPAKINVSNIILLPTWASIIVYALFAIFCFAFVALSFFLFYSLAQGKRVITVTENSITVPAFSFKGIKEEKISFSSLRKLELFQAGNGLFLNIHHAEGKSSLAKLAFRSEQEFNELYKTLSIHVNG